MGFWDWALILGAAVAVVALLEGVTGAWSRWRLDRALAKAAESPPEPAERDRMYGTLCIQGHTLYYTVAGSPIWSVQLDDVRLIGERTTATGPLATDWFLLIFANEPPECFEAPVYAEPAIHQELSRAMATEIQPQLTNSTELRASIAWPRHLEGQPLFSYLPVQRGRGLLERLKDRVRPLVRPELTEGARRHLAGGS